MWLSQLCLSFQGLTAWAKKQFIDLEEETGADIFWSDDLEDYEDDYNELSEESKDDE